MPKKKKDEPDRPGSPRQAKLDLLRQRLRREYDVSLMQGDEIPDPAFRRRPSGILSLDLEIGGGFPCGGLSTLSGPPGTGKTYLCLLAAAQNQQLRGGDSTILYIATENHLAKDHARLANFRVAASLEELEIMDATRRELGKPLLTSEERDYYRTQVGEVDELIGDTAEHLLDSLIEAIRSGAYDLIILDSLTMLIPESERDEAIGEYHIGKAARLKTQFARKIPNALLGLTEGGETNYTCLLAIKQIRANISGGSAHAPKWLESVESYGLNHQRLIGIELTQTDKHPALGEKRGAKFKTRWGGKTIHWYVNKAKSRCHDGATGSFRYDYQTGIDQLEDIFLTGLAARTIAMTGGGWFTLLDRDGDSLIRLHGKQAVLDEMRQAPEVVDEMKLAALLARGIECTYG